MRLIALNTNLKRKNKYTHCTTNFTSLFSLYSVNHVPKLTNLFALINFSTFTSSISSLLKSRCEKCFASGMKPCISRSSGNGDFSTNKHKKPISKHNERFYIEIFLTYCYIKIFQVQLHAIQ